MAIRQDTDSERLIQFLLENPTHTVAEAFRALGLRDPNEPPATVWIGPRLVRSDVTPLSKLAAHRQSRMRRHLRLSRYGDNGGSQFA